MMRVLSRMSKRAADCKNDAGIYRKGPSSAIAYIGGKAAIEGSIDGA